MRRLATIRTIGTSSLPQTRQHIRRSVRLGGRNGARVETDTPTLELLDFPTGELYAMPAATQALLDDSVADVDAWLAEEVRDVFAAQETAAFVNGDGVNKPSGFLTAPGLGAIEPAQFDTDGLLDLIYAPQSRYRSNASFVMNRRHDQCRAKVQRRGRQLHLATVIGGGVSVHIARLSARRNGRHAGHRRRSGKCGLW